MKVYLAGPMRGLPDYNFPAFHDAAYCLRSRGYSVISPAEMDEELDDFDPTSEDGPALDDADLFRMLGRDIAAIADPSTKGVAVLPGWEDSAGARLEVHVARHLGKVVMQAEPPYDVLYTAADSDTRPESCPDVPRVPYGPKRETLGEPVAVDHVHEFPALASPTGEVRIVDASTGGAKGRKPARYELLPWAALDTVAEVYAFGAQKYDDHNWRKGYAWSLSFGALQRHLSAFWEGHDLDDESGLPHLGHAAFHVLALLTYMREHLDGDDRPERPAPCPVRRHHATTYTMDEAGIAREGSW